MYMLLDSTGSAINAYHEEVAAHAALRATVADDPAAAADIFLLAYDDDGNPVGEAVTIEDLPAMTMSIRATAWVTAAHLTRGEYGVNRYVATSSPVVRSASPAAA
jgi:hypothetical protein